MPSQADYLDNSQVQMGVFPPAPVANVRPKASEGYDNMMRGSSQMDYPSMMGPMPANGLLGGAFGSAF
jgi:hypothetical protein